MSTIDPTKIQARLNKLNTPGAPGAPNWIPTDGLRALTSMTVEGGTITFNPNNGIPLKVFVNTESGEIKIFDARAFGLRHT